MAISVYHEQFKIDSETRVSDFERGYSFDPDSPMRYLTIDAYRLPPAIADPTILLSSFVASYENRLSLLWCMYRGVNSDLVDLYVFYTKYGQGEHHDSPELWEALIERVFGTKVAAIA